VSKRQGPAGAGDNDPALRAETIRDALDTILTVEADRREANEKFKRRREKAVAQLKGLGLKMADMGPAIRMAELHDKAQNAEKAEDREAAKTALAIMMASITESYAAVTENAGQLDFDDILEQGAEARKKQFSAPAGKTKTKGGDAAAAPN